MLELCGLNLIWQPITQKCVLVQNFWTIVDVGTSGVAWFSTGVLGAHAPDAPLAFAAACAACLCAKPVCARCHPCQTWQPNPGAVLASGQDRQDYLES